jgi:XTP/dITP diphosphohydrolase
MSGRAFERLVLASGNPGKLKEFRELLEGLPYELVSQRELGIDDPEETGLTFIENALLKARHACTSSGLPALADDSGLVVDALGGRPGLYSARYGGAGLDDAGRVQLLLSELAGVPAERRTARFVCAAVFLKRADDPLPDVVVASWEGSVLEAPRGDGGFGYDPVFLDPLSGRAAAELEREIKNSRSHRALALAQLRARLARHGEC